MDTDITTTLVACATVAIWIFIAIIAIVLSVMLFYHAGRTLGRNILYRTFDMNGPPMTRADNHDNVKAGGIMLMFALGVITIVTEALLEDSRDKSNWSVRRVAALMGRGVIEALLVLLFLSLAAMLFPERPSWVEDRRRYGAVPD